MHAEPRCEPFIGGEPGTYWVDLTIELPPLVPALYTLDFWIGSHNTETYDWIRQAVTIEIVDSPNPRRSFPYHLAHGSIIPPSTVSVRAVSTGCPATA
jgi:hypothetical protein